MFEGSNIIILPARYKTTSKAVIDSFVAATLNAKSSKFVPDVREGTTVDCVIKNNYRGQIFLTAQVNEMAFSKVSLVNVRVVKEIQQRQEVRANVRIPIEVQQLIVNGAYMNLNKPIQMRIRNVSVCGILLNSDLEIPMNVNFRLNLKLDNGTKPFTVIVRTMRREKLIDGKGYNYGCIITTMDQIYANVIRKYIFKRQLEERDRYRRKTCN